MAERVAEIEKMQWDKKRFGLWLTNQRSVVMVPVLAENGGRLVQIRFWTNPRFTEGLVKWFTTLLLWAKPLAAYESRVTGVVRR